MESLVDVSVLIPVYNASEFLVEAIESVWNQTYWARGKGEIVVVDDGSADDSLKILESLAAKSQMY